MIVGHAMVTIARIIGELHLFVVHRMCDEPKIIDMLEYNVGTTDGGEVGQVGELGGEKQDVVAESILDKMDGDEGQSKKGPRLHDCVEGDCELDKVVEAGPQLVEPEPVEGQPIEGEPVGGEGVEGQPIEGEPIGGEGVEGEPVEGQAVEPEPLEAEPLQAEPDGEDSWFRQCWYK